MSKFCSFLRMACLIGEYTLVRQECPCREVPALHRYRPFYQRSLQLNQSINISINQLTKSVNQLLKYHQSMNQYIHQTSQLKKLKIDKQINKQMN